MTHVNELITEPLTENYATVAAQYILTSLYQLSSYLFTKKVQSGEQVETGTSSLQMSFDSYLQSMGEDFNLFERSRSTRRLVSKSEAVNVQGELLRCYQRVSGIYFDEKYVMDLSFFEIFYAELKARKKGGSQRVERELQKLCEALDMVQINLFTQIHCKFQEYFKVVANFQYLKESVSLHIRKLQESRSAMNKVRREFLQKSVNLRRRIVQRQNIEKLLATIKQIKSIKKLPQVLQSILASSLPY